MRCLSLLVLLVASCQDGVSAGQCTISCGPGGACPSGMLCGDDDFCHGGGESIDCDPDPPAPPAPSDDPDPPAAPPDASTCCLQIEPSQALVRVGAPQQFSAGGGVPPYAYSVVFGGGTINAAGLYTPPSSHGYATVAVRDAAGVDSFANIAIEAVHGVNAGARVSNIHDLSLVCGHPGYWGYPRDNEVIELRTSPDGVTKAFGLNFPQPGTGADGGGWQCVNWSVQDRELCTLDSTGTCQFTIPMCNAFYCGNDGPFQIVLDGGTVHFGRQCGYDCYSRGSGPMDY
jgi:hypothetical protein